MLLELLDARSTAAAAAAGVLEAVSKSKIMKLLLLLLLLMLLLFCDFCWCRCCCCMAEIVTGFVVELEVEVSEEEVGAINCGLSVKELESVVFSSPTQSLPFVSVTELPVVFAT